MFTIPTFNLTCNLWTAGTFPGAPRVAAMPCNLQAGRRLHVLDYQENVGITATGSAMFLLTASGSDVRDLYTLAGSDVVEVPAGSGRFYMVQVTDDVGKGFPNEFRFSVICKSTLVPNWPVPIP